jgi:DNA-binding transcriptional MocR family regulator
MRGKPNQTGRDDVQEHWTKMLRGMMQTPAWRSLPPVAQALYPWLKLEWRGPKANNNGRIRFSVSQAAEAVGVNRKTVAKAFHALQARGFIVMTEPARLGAGGAATSPAFEITELALPNSEKPAGRKLYEDWRKGRDFPVYVAAAQNPRGINGKSRVTANKVVKRPT